MGEPFVWDLPQDFADGCQTVTYFRRGRPPGIAVSGAIWRGVPPRRMDRALGWTGVDAVWHLPEQAVPAPIRPGDILQDGAQRRWTVLVVSLTASGRAILWTRDWAASFSAGQTVDVDAGQITRGPGGEPLLGWRPELSGVPVQFLACRSDESVQGSPGPVYRVLVAAELPPRPLRLKTRDGQVYRVERMERPALPGHPFLVHARPLAGCEA